MKLSVFETFFSISRWVISPTDKIKRIFKEFSRIIFKVNYLKKRLWWTTLEEPLLKYLKLVTYCICLGCYTSVPPRVQSEKCNIWHKHSTLEWQVWSKGPQKWFCLFLESDHVTSVYHLIITWYHSVGYSARLEIAKRIRPVYPIGPKLDIIYNR